MLAGAIMDNKLLDPVAFKRLEKMPSKLELIATIAFLINQVSAGTCARLLLNLGKSMTTHCIQTQVHSYN